MSYNIEMQFAGLCLDGAILLSFLNSKKSESLQFRLFPFQLMVAILLIAFDMGSCVAIPHMEAIPVINAFLGKTYLILLYLYVCLSFVYALSCSINYHSPFQRHQKTTILMIISLVSFVIFALYTTFGNLKFYCDPENTRHVYSYGGPANLAYLFTALTIATTIVYLHLNKDTMTTNARIPIWTFVLVELVPAVIQFIFPKLLLVGFATALCEYAIYRSLENSRVEEEQNDIIKTFAEVIESRDESTGEHVKRTTAYVRIIIEKLKENKKYKKILTKEYSDTLIYAAAMHDVGKITIPDAVLQKPGPLDNVERKIIETHTIKGAELINNSFESIGSKLFHKMAYDLSLSHHEKWDGSGYPFGWQKDEIPLSAQIMAVADVFDAVSQNRCYRPPIPLEKSFEIIESGSGTHFAPDIVKAFLDSKEIVTQTYHIFMLEDENKNEEE